ncbi:MAG: ABC transporter ATP-binding protein [Novosphingobium sp.]
MSLKADNLTLAGRLNGVSLDLRAGELTAIVGPNGAGKSSLIASLAGLLDAGTVTLDGVALDRMVASDRARAIGFLPQTPEVAWDVTVETLVSLGRLPWKGAPGGAAIKAAIAAMDLADLRGRPMSQLSGGERARALLARVLAGEPRWLLADEPLANLDLAHARSLIAMLQGQAREGRGVVVVVHDLAAAMNHADRVIVMADGAIAADGPPRQALRADIVARVWQIGATWLGEPGQMALSI